ncbi:MAG: UDP-N-acetylmuramoyl-tripeptide--D-alanyl-D-alanine ligase, partial [Bdellovibrionaceae bacterium]|nr:UDP-N-acetylmuramoyl-tripeptide--D-alanyl-D-alanine ligase [Pseudobdellovibrionaceae bacterium]
MRSISLEDLCAVTGGRILRRGEPHFKSIGTDTRKDLTGALFIALKGETHDAHQYLDKALVAGAAGLLIHDESALPVQSGKASVVLVPDTLRALQQLGTWSRRLSRAKVVGITGSNGKTTTKEFTAAIISQSMSVHYNEGSFNNHWGVPFNLLQLPVDVDVAVVEMGMNHAGEITRLVEIAEPDVVVCTMVGRAHIEHFGTIDGIAAAKEEIYKAASPQATRIYNLDNHYTLQMHLRHRYPGRSLTFSEKQLGADVCLRVVEMDLYSMVVEGHILGESGSARIPVFGRQNITNLMAAAACGAAVGMDPQHIWQGLTRCKTSWGRNQILNLKSGALALFDAYNANPDSMQALMQNIHLL